MPRKPTQEALNKQKYLADLQALRLWQDSPEWRVFKAFLQSQAENSPALGEYRRSVYINGEDPSHVAVRNELFSAFKAGLIYSTKMLDEVISALENDLNA